MGPLTVFVLGGVTALLTKDTLAKAAHKSLSGAVRMKRKIEQAAQAAIEDAQDAVAAAEKGNGAREQQPS